MLDIVNKWPFLDILDSNFLSSVRKVYAFSNNGSYVDNVIFITEDDEVYGMGRNENGCLGIGNNQSTMEAKPIPILFKKNITAIFCGSLGYNVMALTSDGAVYSWGLNDKCQLGNGTTTNNFSPILIENIIGTKKVAAISCGYYHCMVVTDDSEIYTWGNNNCGQIGSGSTTSQSTPYKVALPGIAASRKVTEIGCTAYTSIVLLDNGEVYCWGKNTEGELGINNKENQVKPCKVQFVSGTLITKLVCGSGHVLALSEQCEVFSWGSNECFQLGSEDSSVTQHKIISDEKFVEIAASPSTNISIAMNQQGTNYAWGVCKGQKVKAMIPTRYVTVDEAFVSMTAAGFTWRLYITREVTGSNILDNIKKAFNNEETSDIKFYVGSETIYAHKFFLKMQSEYFRRMFSEKWKENEENAIKVTEYRPVVYSAYLRYLYTDTVNLPAEDAIDLLDLANACGELSLKKKCQTIIIRGITNNNVFMLYAAAAKYDAQDLQEVCYRFAVKNLTTAFASDAFNTLDDSLVKGFIRRAAEEGVFIK